MDLDELEKRLSKGYRVYKKIRTTLNLKDEWDFIKLKILFMRQYSQLYIDAFEPVLGYFYLQKADEYVEKRKRINRTAWEDDVNFYKYLVEIDRTNFFILTNQYHELLRQCEVYIDCASKLEEYKKKPINILVPFRIYVGCGMIYEFFNQDNDLVVNAFLRGVQIIEKNIDDVGRYFLQNDLLIYVQAYVKIVKCKLRLRDFENAELWARSTLKFIEDNYYLLRLENDSKVVKKIQNLHKKALKEQNIYLQPYINIQQNSTHIFNQEINPKQKTSNFFNKLQLNYINTQEKLNINLFHFKQYQQ